MDPLSRANEGHVPSAAGSLPAASVSDAFRTTRKTQGAESLAAAQSASDRSGGQRGFRRTRAVGNAAGRGGRPGAGDQPCAIEPRALDEAASSAHRTPVPDQPRLGDVPAQGCGRRDHAVEFPAVSVGRAVGGRAGRRQSRDDQDVGVHATHDGTVEPHAARVLCRRRGRGVRRRSRSRRRLFPHCRSTTSSSPGRPPWACTSCVLHRRT